jgi:hypothetical protein
MLRAKAIQSRFNELLESSWRTQTALFTDPVVGRWLLRCATPILAFGRWETARIATAGLNPSEREFMDEFGQELQPPQRRFLHRTATHGAEPSASALAEARRMAEGYFELGNAYWLWFERFRPLLDELRWTFESGDACHTDYITPFATKKGIGSVAAPVRRALQSEGLLLWRAVLDLMPALRIVFGIGAGWRLMPEAFSFDNWDPIPTSFDTKGRRAPGPKPYLLHKLVALQGRSVHLFWWRPNRGEPLTWLGAAEKRHLAILVKERMAA